MVAHMLYALVYPAALHSSKAVRTVWHVTTWRQVVSHRVFIRAVIRTQAESSLQQQQNGHMEAKHMALKPLGRRNTYRDECWDAANKADFNMSN